jgi:hypothetical protein
MKELFILLVIYQLKHFLADYILQGKYMLGKFKDGWEWLLPLFLHVLVHGVCTYGIALFIKPELALSLATFDMIVHFIMDRIKASPNLLGRFKPLTVEQYGQLKLYDNANLISHIHGEFQSNAQLLRSNTLFWWCLGLDQMVHHLTHYVIIYVLVVGGI